MSRWVPCKRRTFIKRLQSIGFDGPYSGSKHQFLIFKNHRLTIPSNNEYSIPQLKMMIREVEEIIGREMKLNEWINL